MNGLFFVQTKYSISQSTLPIDSVFEHAITNNYKYICFADNSLRGIYKIYNHASKHDIKVVYALATKLKIADDMLDVLLLVKNQKGLETLFKLNLLIADFVDDKILNQYFDGLSLIVLANNADFSLNTIQKVQKQISNYLPNIFLAISPNVSYSTNFTKSKNCLPFAIFNHKEGQNDLLELVVSIGKTTVLAHSHSIDACEEFIKLPTTKLLSNNLSNLINQVEPIVFKSTKRLPKVKQTDDEQLKFITNLSQKGLQKRLSGLSTADINTYQSRLDYELKVIKELGFVDYFLTVYDFVLYAKKHNILVGPGRGSVCASLVAYCLGITQIDPIKYELLFERFLNPMRQSDPDIDIDFEDVSRQDVINYVAKKYGPYNVSSIATFVEFAKKSSIRDVFRYLNLDSHRQAALTKRMNDNKVDQNDEVAVKAERLANGLISLIRQTGTHAAGVIISNEPLDTIIPVKKDSASFLQSQFEANDLEALGLVKFDFLGLKNLSIIKEILQLLPADFNIDTILLNDAKTFKLLESGETAGIFQLESAGFRRLLKRFKITNFDDIVAILALNRPGPSQFIDTYFERKTKSVAFEYLDNDLIDILKPTYGVIVYQEQIMQILSKFANYSLAEADIFRRAIGKKDHTLMDEQKTSFVKKAIANNKDEALALKVYEYIVRFADYGFNKAHSVAYALFAYQMAFIKANYPQEFLSVLMKYSLNSPDEMKGYLDWAKSQNIKFVAPDIRYATTNFLIGKTAIMFPLNAINSVSTSIVEQIVAARDKRFVSLDDFLQKCGSFIRQETLNNLILAGCFDWCGQNKKTLLDQADLKLFQYRRYITDMVIEKHDEFSKDELIGIENKMYGFNPFTNKEK